MARSIPENREAPSILSIFKKSFFSKLPILVQLSQTGCMQNKPTRPEAVQTQKRYLSIPEAVQEYGGSLGFWRKRVFLKQIPYIKAGRSVRLSREDLDAWHAARKISAGEAKHVD
jgi:hypothetical protein